MAVITRLGPEDWAPWLNVGGELRLLHEKELLDAVKPFAGQKLTIDIRQVTLLSREGCEALKKAADLVYEKEGGRLIVLYPLGGSVEEALVRTDTINYWKIEFAESGTPPPWAADEGPPAPG
jgi:hypothetical protein